MKNVVAYFLTLALALASVTVAALAEPIVIKVGHPSEADVRLPGSGITAGVLALKNFVEVESNGEIVVEVHPNSSLGNPRTMIESAQAGAIQMVGAYTAIMMPFAPEVSVTQIPYIFKNNLVAWKVMNGPVGDELAQVFLDKTGLRVLGWADGAGYRHIYSENPVNGPEDLKGRKMRVPENPGLLAMFRAWGANTITITWTELYTGLQTGMAEGHDTELYSMYSAKLYEVNPHVTMTRHSFNLHPLLVNEEFLQSLSPKHREIVLQGGDMYTRVANAHSMASSLVVQNVMTEKGAKFHYPSDEQIAQFKALGQQPYIDTIVKKIGPDTGQQWVAKIIAAANAAESEL